MRKLYSTNCVTGRRKDERGNYPIPRTPYHKEQLKDPIMFMYILACEVRANTTEYAGASRVQTAL